MTTKYKFYLRNPFEKDLVIISKHRKFGRKPLMVLNKKNHKKEPKYYATDEATIYLSVRYYGKRVVLNTRQRINPIHWNFDTKTPKVGKAPGLTKALDTFKEKIENLFDEKAASNEIPTVNEVRASVAIKIDSEFFEVYKLFLEYYSENGIVRSFGQTRDKIKKMNPGIEFNDIDQNFHDTFIKTLKKQGLNKNTQGRHVKNLKLFMKWSRLRKKHNSRDFEDFKIKSEAVMKIFFNLGELDSIINHKFDEGSRLDKVRDLFIVSAFTGLRYVDYIRLIPQHIKTGQLKIITAKSSYELSSEILPEAQAIFDKWLRLTGGESIIPPKISNVKLNLYLKEMIKEIEELKEVTTLFKKDNKETWELKSDHTETHSGRRSFASNMFYSKLMDIRAIMELTGHKTMSSFEKYILPDDQGYYKKEESLKTRYKAYRETRKAKMKIAI